MGLFPDSRRFPSNTSDPRFLVSRPPWGPIIKENEKSTEKYSMNLKVESWAQRSRREQKALNSKQGAGSKSRVQRPNSGEQDKRAESILVVEMRAESRKQGAASRMQEAGSIDEQQRDYSMQQRLESREGELKRRQN
jgi:hypothetical protein